MDDADLAAEREQANIEWAVRQAQKNLEEAQARNGGPVYCEDCDDEIPPKRIAAIPSARRCIGCQSAAER